MEKGIRNGMESIAIEGNKMKSNLLLLGGWCWLIFASEPDICSYLSFLVISLTCSKLLTVSVHWQREKEAVPRFLTFSTVNSL